MSKPQRKAIVVEGTSYVGCLCCHPMVFTQMEESFKMSKMYTRVTFENDFPADALLVIEPTDDFSNQWDPADSESKEHHRIWRLVDE